MEEGERDKADDGPDRHSGEDRQVSGTASGGFKRRPRPV